jgi:hypothetical protein
VIGKVLDRGRRVGGLVRYLYGPGKREEHRDPHIVASWSGETTTLDPTVTARGRRDFRNLVGLLEAPLMAQPAWLREERPVYHVVSRAAPEDRILSDAEWAAVATEMMHHIGLSRRGAEDAGVRWVAVRHADDHIHIVATLARQDGRVARRDNDFYRLRDTCRAFEVRYGLRRTAPADNTAARRPHRAELEKALRSGRRETVRDRLRREVRAAVAVAYGEADFFARLRAAGVMVRLRYSTVEVGQVTGYAVTMPGARTANGTPVWYGGGRLAADLTLPRLRHRWDYGAGEGRRAGVPTPPRASAEHRRRVLGDVVGEMDRALEELRQAATSGSTGFAASAAAAAADVATVTARVVEGRWDGPLSRAADHFDHAVRERYGRVPRPHGRVEALRAAARLLAAVRRLHPDDDALQAAELVSRLAGLADTVALLRRHERRAHQAAAGRRAAVELRTVAASFVERGARRTGQGLQTTWQARPAAAHSPSRRGPG